MPQVICKLPNAAEQINGVRFSRQEIDGVAVMVSDEIDAEAAELFASIPGYELAPVDPEEDARRKAAEAEAAARAAEEAARRAAEAKAAVAKPAAKGGKKAAAVAPAPAPAEDAEPVAEAGKDSEADETVF